MNLIVDPILALSGGERASLPELFAALARGEARGFPALRPHQRPAWHMFLVQLAALALWKEKREHPHTDARAWAAALRRLTPDYADDEPWRLVVEDGAKPAFMQPPTPGKLKWSDVQTPDALDMLITARNHDLKQAVARRAAPEDWVYALVSLQTCEGYGGRGNNGIARMNGGASSRPLLGLAPVRRDGDISMGPSAWWARDVRLLLKERGRGSDSPVGTVGGLALLWCLHWPEGRQLEPGALDPWFIEVCRRVRLEQPGDTIRARRASSKAARIDAKALKGNLCDPWAPVHRVEGKSLTLGGGDFDYRRLRDLLFSGDWARPLLARPADGETRGMLLVAEAFSRGNTKTEGFKSRTVPVPGKVLPFFSCESMATLAKAQLAEIEGFDTALRDALALMAAGGDREKKFTKTHYGHARPARKGFDRAADRLFFPSLWKRVAALSQGDEAMSDAKRAFLSDLMDAAKKELAAALRGIPCPSVHRPRAETRARQAFGGIVRRKAACRDLFNVGEADDAAQ